MGIFGGKKRIVGRIRHAREIAGEVKVELIVSKASANSFFSGKMELEKLRGKRALLTVDKIENKE